MLSWALFCLGLLFVFLFYKIVFLFFDSKSDIKEAFGLPFYYSVVNHDLGKNPKKFYIKYNGVVGTPDALFKMFLLPIWVVGEAKSRNLHIKPNTNPLHLREEYQLMLYIGIVKKLHPFSLVRGKFRFKNEIYSLDFNNKTFKHVLKHKKDAIRAVNCLR